MFNQFNFSEEVSRLRSVIMNDADTIRDAKLIQLRADISLGYHIGDSLVELEDITNQMLENSHSLPNDIHLLVIPLLEIRHTHIEILLRLHAKLGQIDDVLTRYYMEALLNVLDNCFQVGNSDDTVNYVKSNIHLIPKRCHPVFGVWISQYDSDFSYSVLFGSLHKEEEYYNMFIRNNDVIAFLCKNGTIPSNDFLKTFPNLLESVVIILKEQCIGPISEDILIKGYDILVKHVSPQSIIEKIINENHVNYSRLFFKVCRRSITFDLTQEIWEYVKETDLVFSNHFKASAMERALTCAGDEISTIILHFPHSVNAIPHQNLINYLIDPSTNLSAAVLQIVIDNIDDPFLYANIVAEWKSDYSTLPIPLEISQNGNRIILTGTPFDKEIYNRLPEIPLTFFKKDFNYSPVPTTIQRTPQLMRLLAYLITSAKLEIEYPFTPVDFEPSDTDKIASFLEQTDKLESFEIPPNISDVSAMAYFQTIYKSVKIIKNSKVSMMNLIKRLISIEFLYANATYIPSLHHLIYKDPQSEENSPYHDLYIRAAIKAINGMCTNFFSSNSKVLTVAKYAIYVCEHSQFNDLFNTREFAQILRRLFDRRAKLSIVLSSDPDGILLLEEKFIESIKSIHIEQEQLVFDLSLLQNMLNHFKTETIKINEIIFTAQNRKSFPRIVYKHGGSLKRALRICQIPKLQGEILALAFRSKLISVIDDFFRNNEISDGHALIIKQLYASGYRSKYLIERITETCLKGFNVFRTMLWMFAGPQDEAIKDIGLNLYESLYDNEQSESDEVNIFFLKDLPQPSDAMISICQLLIDSSKDTPHAVEIIEQLRSPLHFALLKGRHDVFELYSKLKNPIRFFVELIGPFDVATEFIDWSMIKLFEPDHNQSKQIIVNIFAEMLYCNGNHIFSYYFMKHGWERCITELDGVFNIDCFFNPCIFTKYLCGDSCIDFLQIADKEFTGFKLGSLSNKSEEEKRSILIDMLSKTEQIPNYIFTPDDFEKIQRSLPNCQNLSTDELSTFVSSLENYKAAKRFFTLSNTVISILIKKFLSDNHKMKYSLANFFIEWFDFDPEPIDITTKLFVELIKDEYPVQNVFRFGILIKSYQKQNIPEFNNFLLNNFYNLYEGNMAMLVTLNNFPDYMVSIQIRCSIMENIQVPNFQQVEIKSLGKDTDLIKELILMRADTADIPIEVAYYISYLPPDIIHELEPILVRFLDQKLDNLLYVGNDNYEEGFIAKLLDTLCPVREHSGSIAGMNGAFINEHYVTTEFIRIPKPWLETSPYWQVVFKHRAKVISLLMTYTMNLKIIVNYPELFSFKAKHSMFLSYYKKELTDEMIKIKIHREKVFEDTMNDIILSPNIIVKFAGEKGYDGGGLTREWITLFFEEVEKRKMFIQNEFGESSPNEKFSKDEFRVFGKVAGIAFVNNITIPIRFSAPEYKRFLEREFTLRDIRAVDPQIFSSLEYILHNDPEDIGITFAANIKGKEIELIPCGSSIPVTQLNKEEYVNRYIAEYFNDPNMTALAEGFNEILNCGVVETAPMMIFTPYELMRAMSGIVTINTEMFIRWTKFMSPFDENTPVVKMFFEAIRGFNVDEMTELLVFITGMRSVPTLGLSITLAPGGDPPKLPTAHTCHGILKLPLYTSVEETARALRIAIESCKSFEFM